MKQYASIFNDVLGPVMRGPSSSHTAAAVRIGQAMRNMITGEPVKFDIYFDPSSSLAATYHTHGSDIGLIGGLLNMAPKDENLKSSLEIAKNQGILIDFIIEAYDDSHPNIYKMKLESDKDEHIHATALSMGGGMMVFTDIQGFNVDIDGGFYETLIIVNDINKNELQAIANQINDNNAYCGCFLANHESKTLLNIKSDHRLNINEFVDNYHLQNIDQILQIDKILPILSQKIPNVPFCNVSEMMALHHATKKPIWELAMMYEAVRGNTTQEDVYEKMTEVVNIMRHSVDAGLMGTTFENRILHYQSYKLKEAYNRNQLIGDSLNAAIIANITAIMEQKSAMGVFVAAPTAGSCGGLPGTVLAVADYLNLKQDAIIEAMFCAGIIGAFIAMESTFSAELAGCQAECGAGSGMAAAALVHLKKGESTKIVDAASMALQSILGMVCDPVANGVEVPCLGKNIMCGFNALSCANMALAGMEVVIPFEEVLVAFDEVGRSIPCELRCTGLGGISTTPTSIAIGEKLI